MNQVLLLSKRFHFKLFVSFPRMLAKEGEKRCKKHFHWQDNISASRHKPDLVHERTKTLMKQPVKGQEINVKLYFKSFQMFLIMTVNFC